VVEVLLAVEFTCNVSGIHVAVVVFCEVSLSVTVAIIRNNIDYLIQYDNHAVMCMQAPPNKRTNMNADRSMYARYYNYCS
jgi:hypothetical protein